MWTTFSSSSLKWDILCFLIGKLTFMLSKTTVFHCMWSSLKSAKSGRNCLGVLGEDMSKRGYHRPKQGNKLSEELGKKWKGKKAKGTHYATYCLKITHQ